uniref:glycosyltransferase family 2 protein n=1 Tax=Agathobacter sp. TaxID=2021311 RepID=UPI004057A8A6
MNNNKITIIVPVYNIANYIEKCIESIINQTYRNIEIILIDDGSTDNSGEICSCYAKKDSRIIVIHQKNGGLVNARKAGLNAATGEYVIFVDGDDYIEPVLCQKMLEYIAKLDVDFVHANYIENGMKVIECIEHGENYFGNELSFQKRISLISDNVFCNLISKRQNSNLITPSLWSKIFKTEFIKNCYFDLPDSQSFGEDLLCLCHLIMRCKNMALITEAYYNYRLRENSLSHEYNLENIARISGLYSNLKILFSEYGCWDFVSWNIKDYYAYCIMDLLKRIQTKEFHINKYYYGAIQELINKKIILYGAGIVGRDYYDQICRYQDISVLDWVDYNSHNISCEYFHIEDISRLYKNDYDIVLIAILDKHNADACIKGLVQQGIPKEKLLWRKPKENRLNLKYL